VRAIKEVKPRYFLVENNYGMPKEAEAIITEELGVTPIMIDSQLLTAQRRKRLYWTNIQGVKQPEDKNVLFQDILESGIAYTKKSYCLTANYTGAYPADLFKSVRSQVFEPSDDGKFAVKDGIVTIPGYKRKPGCETVKVPLIPDGKYNIRKMTLKECCELQSVPESYFEGFKTNSAIKALGNGWTVDVIAHIFNNIHATEDVGKRLDSDNYSK
jgi:DNA (cytosine-5)-methyltransferase 3A